VKPEPVIRIGCARWTTCSNGRGPAQGKVMRPGAPLVPFCVWHVLQSPLVCATGMIRSRP
jgi:hypothetical protein